MKIVLSARRFVPPFTGGVDVYTDRLARALKRLGHEVVVLAFDSSAGENGSEIQVSRDEYQGIDVWRLEFDFTGRPQQAFDDVYDREMGQVTKRILAEQKPDLFIVMNFYLVTLASVEVAEALGIPVVHIATDFVPICRRATLIRWDGNPCQVGESITSCSACFVSHHPAGRLAAMVLNRLPEVRLTRLARTPAFSTPPHPLWILKPYWKQVALMERRLKTIQPLREKIAVVLAPTQYTLNMFLANGFAPEQLHLLPFAIEPDHPLSRIERVPAPHIRFLFIGRLQPYKGAHLLVEAFNALPSPGEATLTIYGGPDGYQSYYDRLQAMIASNERIRFAGTIAPAELGNAFAEADVFVLPSIWHENSPLILLDALQSRTPVIASDIGGITDVIDHEVNGLLFPMGNRGALQKTLQRVIDQPHLLARLRPEMNLPNIDTYAETVVTLARNRVAGATRSQLQADQQLKEW